MVAAESDNEDTHSIKSSEDICKGDEINSENEIRPFSAITKSLWPYDYDSSNDIAENQSIVLPEDCRIDEFGFIIDCGILRDSHKHNKLSTQPLQDDSQYRLKWMSQLEFNDGNDLSWDNVNVKLPKSEKITKMVRTGIPHAFRPHLWMRYSGALEKKLNSSDSYTDIVKYSNLDELASSHTIEKDILRTLPGNVVFSGLQSIGVGRLRRVLRAINYSFPAVGYCQGVGAVVGYLLLFFEEEDAFWMMAAILENLLPSFYYANGLTGATTDVHVMQSLLGKYLPELHNALEGYDAELHVIGISWFLPAFCHIVHVKLLLRIWDVFFYEGSIAFLRIALGLFKKAEPQILEANDSAAIFNLLYDLPGQIDDIDSFIELCYEISAPIDETEVASLRHKQHAYMLVERGTLLSNPGQSANLPKQRLSRRPLKKPKSVLKQMFENDENEEDLKNKNVRQTELLIDLRDAIVQVARHFMTIDPEFSDASLMPNYSLESHAKDIEIYNGVPHRNRIRAKALLDFERRDDDELGFRKNDVITILSKKDDHCWIGELNGLSGWFPAKFAEVLDERSKRYSSAGDDAVSKEITDLVRGTLCHAIKLILEHGLKRPTIIGGPGHPWLFIEEAAAKAIEKDYYSVHGKLVLCKTFNLDEDDKILTPEELLFRSVQSINISHDEAHAHLDVKLRSLICIGLNEQVLHIWFEVLCTCLKAVEKWYLPWSFISSPGWVQIKCELRILSQFPFRLNAERELPARKESCKQLKEGVRDMLVKHHLFSWDL